MSFNIFGARTVKGTSIKLTSEEEDELKTMYWSAPREVSEDDYNKVRARLAAKHGRRSKGLLG